MQRYSGGAAGHLVDSLFEGEDLLFLDEVSDDVREGAAGSGVALFLPAACQTVAAHDAVGVADDLADILVAHAAVNAARLTVVGDAHIEECLPRSLPIESAYSE